MKSTQLEVGNLYMILHKIFIFKIRGIQSICRIGEKKTFHKGKIIILYKFIFVLTEIFPYNYLEK
jgi:hypothetical protein